MAILGFGYWGANLARNVEASSRARLVAIADGVDDRREIATKKHVQASVVRELSSVLERDDVEAVIISTPAATHGDLALEVLGSDRHVLVEKPLALTVDNALDVAQAADEAGLVGMVGHTFLYSEPVRRLRQIVAAGELGVVRYVYSQRLSLGRIRDDVGALWNFAPHDVSILLFLLSQRPLEVSARGFSLLGSEREDVCFASLLLEEGVAANLHVSWLDPKKVRRMTLVGEDRMAVYDDVSVDQKIQLVDAGAEQISDLGEFATLGDFQWRTRAGDIHVPQIAIREPLLNEIDAFADAIRSGDSPTASARHGVDVVRVVAAIEESTRRRGAPVPVAW